MKKGSKASEETKRRMRKNHADFRGKNNPNFGNKLSEETKRKLSIDKKGKNNPAWEDGKTINSWGYILVYAPTHPSALDGKYVFEHRLIMERHLERYLKPEERIHHKGTKYPIGSIENKQDNRIENLQLFNSNGEHIKFHNKLRREAI